MLQSFDEFVLFSFLIFVNRSCDNVLKKLYCITNFLNLGLSKDLIKGGNFRLKENELYFWYFACVYMFFISSEIVCTYLLKRFLFIFYLKKDGLSCHKRRKDAKMCGPEIKIILNFVF